MATTHLLKAVHQIGKGLIRKSYWINSGRTSSVVTVPVVFMTSLTDFEPLAKKIKVEKSCNNPTTTSPTPASSSNQILAKDAAYSSDNAMDLKAKNGAGPANQNQPKKFKNTLDCWLVKPQASEKMAKTSEGNPVQSKMEDNVNSQSTEQSVWSNCEEETQLLTSQELLEADASNNMDASPSPSKNPKITHFFTGSSGGSASIKRSRMDISDGSEEVEEEEEPDVRWLGTPIEELKRRPQCRASLPKLKNDPQIHTVMIRTDLLAPGSPPGPHPKVFQDVWDDVHVKMPCSTKNLFPVRDQETEELENKSRWELIEESLREEFSDVLDLKEAILKYNASYAKKWDFTALDLYCTKVLDSDSAEHLFECVLPEMVQLSLRAPQLLTKPVPLLKRGKNHSVSLSQEQISCLLSNAFFCTFPRRNSRKTEYRNYPDINFFRLFEGSSSRKIEKLKTLMCYFKTVTEQMPNGVVTFTRRSLENPVDWTSSLKQFTRLHISCDGTIEDDGHGMLQVDFANQSVGGGVTSLGLVQEEIRFLINPELIVSRLFTEALDDNECLVITGSQQFSKYTGYSQTYRWAGRHHDTTARDAWMRRCTEIVAIDALQFRSFMEQFKPEKINRELNKAFCGFARPEEEAETLAAVATGNWGCGVFGGDARLKALLQLCAAAESGRDVAYFTFGDKQLMTDVHRLHCFLCQRHTTVGEIYNTLEQYYSRHILSCSGRRPEVSLYTFIYRTLSSSPEPAKL
ncbi:unnamed protein product [Knipowitschia caucasica]|uniref:poly(ADP-ribose) glycohydrolase n=1 Tax=Knipowitschia caucasica TaxID=637954 RepID=A0AAV2LGU5_KNICA